LAQLGHFNSWLWGLGRDWNSGHAQSSGPGTFPNTKSGVAESCDETHQLSRTIWEKTEKNFLSSLIRVREKFFIRLFSTSGYPEAKSNKSLPAFRQIKAKSTDMMYLKF
jgi:hypothetical protein